MRTSRKSRPADRLRLVLVSIVLVVTWLALLPGLALADGPSVDEINRAIKQQGLQWTAREYDRTFATGVLFELEPEPPKEPTISPRPAYLPSSLDWRNNGGNFVSPVKSQGGCGSCWAFAGTGALEALRAVTFDTPGSFLDLSEQILVSCCTANSGCSGGSMYRTAEFLKDEGTYHESCFPYTATDNDCGNACWDWRSRAFRIETHEYVSRSVDNLKTALQDGPMAVAFNTYSDFHSYGGGVYECSDFSGDPGGHAVLLVGYRDTYGQTGGGHFIVKNSWDDNWGESGYFRIGYSQVTNNVRFGRSAYQYFLECPDPWEPDDTSGQANTISTNGTPQREHRFCEAGDQDWIKFYAVDRWQYTIETYNLGSGCDTYMYLYQQNGSTQITYNDDGGTGLASRISWSAEATGWYYIKVRHYSSSRSGIDTSYDINVESQEPPNRPPSSPSSPSPADGAGNQSSYPELRWTGGDPDWGDTVRYDVYLGSSNPPGTRVCQSTSIAWCMSPGLNYDARYYWRVIATDNHGASTTGPVWDFRTTPNTAPGAVSVNPSSGSCAAGQIVEFEASYSDDNGWQDVKWAHLSVGQHNLGADGFRAYYNQNSNKVFLMNDDGTAWLGGLPPGSSAPGDDPTDPESSAVIENSKVILRPEAMSVTGWGNRLNVKWSVMFKRFTSGDKTVYLNVRDDGNLESGWRVRGSWTVNGTNFPPVAEAVSPSSGSSNTGDTVDFSTTYSDPNGWPQLKWIMFALGDDASGADGVYAYCNLNANKVYLRNDAGTGWLGGFAPGSSQTIENSKAILRLAPMTVTGTGNRVQVKWSMRLKRLVTGNKKIYLKAIDDHDATGGWTTLGNWTVNGTNVAPSADGVSPDSGSCNSGEVVDFTTTCSDGNGWPQMKWVTLSIGRNVSGADGLYAYYSQSANKVYLMNDQGTAWLGGLAPGSSETIQNSKVILRLAPMTVTGAGDRLDVKWSLRFKVPVTGEKNVYLKATDDAGAVGGWSTVGTWRVNGTNSAPSADSVTPNSGSSAAGDAASFTTTCSDANGWPQIKWVTLAIGEDWSGADGLYAYYDQVADKVYLRNDEGTGWLGGLSPGADRTIENSKVILRLAPMTVSGAGNRLEVKWALRFKRFVTGDKNVYLKVTDDTGSTSGWRILGNWTVTGVNYAPSGTSVTPDSGLCDAAEVTDFAAVYSDPNGWPHIKWANLCIGQGRSGADGLYAYCSLSTNKVYLLNDEGTGWLGGFAPGSSQTIENSKVLLRLAPMSVSGVGDNLTVNWSVRFKRYVTGDKSIYLKATDDTNATSGWSTVGSWTVNGTDYAPSVESVVPDSGSCNYGDIIGFTTTISDPNGWPQIKWVVFSVGETYSGADGLRAYYNQNSNKVYLINDDGTAWLGGASPGSALTVENSRIMLRITPMTVVGAGDRLTVNWSLRFKRSAVGLKNIYVRVCDDAGLCTTEEWLGAWTVRGPDLGDGTVKPFKILLEPMEERGSDEGWILPIPEPLNEGPGEIPWKGPDLEPKEETGQGLWELPLLGPLEEESSDTPPKTPDLEPIDEPSGEGLWGLSALEPVEEAHAPEGSWLPAPERHDRQRS